jgi:hypothetical protein
MTGKYLTNLEDKDMPLFWFLREELRMNYEYILIILSDNGEW